MRLIIFTLTLIAFCMFLIAGARAIGQTQDPPPTNLATGDCDQPCWQGLQPGVHLRGERVLERVQSSPFNLVQSVGYSGYVAMFEIRTNDDLILADVLHEFGAPERVACLQPYRFRWQGVGGTHTQLYYGGGAVVVTVEHPEIALHLSPDMTVWSIQYFRPGDSHYPPGEPTDWRGLTGIPVYSMCGNR
jgi:hypothetical protein